MSSDLTGSGDNHSFTCKCDYRACFMIIIIVLYLAMYYIRMEIDFYALFS